MRAGLLPRAAESATMAATPSSTHYVRKGNAYDFGPDLARGGLPAELAHLKPIARFANGEPPAAPRCSSRMPSVRSCVTCQLSVDTVSHAPAGAKCAGLVQVTRQAPPAPQASGEVGSRALPKPSCR